MSKLRRPSLSSLEVKGATKKGNAPEEFADEEEGNADGVERNHENARVTVAAHRDHEHSEQHSAAASTYA